MAKFTFQATVNYPETELKAPPVTDLTERQVGLMVMGLLVDEQLTSCLITIVKHQED